MIKYLIGFAALMTIVVSAPVANAQAPSDPCQMAETLYDVERGVVICREIRDREVIYEVPGEGVSYCAIVPGNPMMRIIETGDHHIYLDKDTGEYYDCCCSVHGPPEDMIIK